MHYYQFNIGDYIKHTVHLSNDEDLAYRRLLDMYYDTEQPIPTDIPLVSRRLRMGCEVVQAVLSEFFELTDEGYRNRRADAEIEAYNTYQEKQRANGKLGGRPKKTHRFPTANPSQTQPEPKKSLNTPSNQEPINNNNNPPNPPKGGTDFEKIEDPVCDDPPKKSKAKTESRGTRLPSDFELPSDWVDFCVTERPDLDAKKLFYEFRDYWIAQPGAKGRKLDWFATWRNRVRSARKLNHGNNYNADRPYVDNSAAGRVRAAVARERAAEAETECNPKFVANHDLALRPQMDLKLRNRN